MVDSDENNTNSATTANTFRKRRDRSFRGDREDIGSNNSRGSRDSWRSRKSHHGHGPSMYNRGYNKSPCRYRDHSPSISYTKRIRRDWDSQENNAFHYSLPNQVYPDIQNLQAVYPIKDESPNGYAQMLSFKAFLNEQEDNIDESDAAHRYTEYKNEFRRNQISDFFLTHKEEEWFRSKYDPEMKKIRMSKERKNILNRLEMCMELYEEGYLDDIRLDLDQSERLIQILDTAVMRLETKESSKLAKIKKDNSDAIETLSSSEGQIDSTSNPLQNNDADVDTVTSKNILGSNSGAPDETSLEEDIKTNDESDDINPFDNQNFKNESIDYEIPDKYVTNVINATTNDDDTSAKTCSIFLRSLPSSVTREEIENLCQKYDGFKRAALADPLPERRFQRRGWLTFEPWVDVKKICWELNSQKLWSSDVGAIVNRELIRRIRPVDSITNYVNVMLNDAKMIISIVNCMDTKWSLWNKDSNVSSDIDNEAKKDDDDDNNIGGNDENQFASSMNKNPFVKNAESILQSLRCNVDVEEAKSGDEDVNLEVANEQLKKSVDQLIIYLRFVHSIDFYNAVEYQLEDHMPNRCGILHVRSGFGIEDQGAMKERSSNLLQSKVTETSGTKEAVRSADSKSLDTSKTCESDNAHYRMTETIKHWIEKFNERLEHFTHSESTSIDLEYALRLGLKDEEAEVEKFISQNTVKVGEDKWSCPLSGKKFRGPEFVRKHIFNKHQDKIDGVRREVQCFNNFVMDPKRPHLPEQIITRPIIFAPCVPYKSSGYHFGAQSSAHNKFSHHLHNMWTSVSTHPHQSSKSRGSRGGSIQNSAGTDGHQNKTTTLLANREREAVKYDINYSDLEDANFHQC